MLQFVYRLIHKGMEINTWLPLAPLPSARLTLGHAIRWAESIHSFTTENSSIAPKLHRLTVLAKEQLLILLWFFETLPDSAECQRRGCNFLPETPTTSVLCCWVLLDTKACRLCFVLGRSCHYKCFRIAMNPLKSVVPTISDWLHKVLNTAGNSPLTLLSDGMKGLRFIATSFVHGPAQAVCREVRVCICVCRNIPELQEISPIRPELKVPGFPGGLTKPPELTGLKYSRRVLQSGTRGRSAGRSEGFSADPRRHPAHVLRTPTTEGQGPNVALRGTIAQHLSLKNID